MKTYLHLWHHLAKFFLEWEIFQTTGLEIIETHFMFSFFVSLPKLYCFWVNTDKYGRARQATDDNIMRHGKDALWVPVNLGKTTDTHS
jgi:hypothetical protein